MDEVVINGEVYVKKERTSDLVIVRTYSAGVHVGELVLRDGKEVVLRNSRIIHRWKGANTLYEIALHGVDTEDYTRISEIDPNEVLLMEAIQVHRVSEKAKESLVPVWNS